MKYCNEQGEIAEVLSHAANRDNKIRIQIDGEACQRVVDYDWFIAEFRQIPINPKSVGMRND